MSSLIPLDIFEKSFAEYLPETITAMDIDTTRFTEYVWSYRAAHGLETGAFIYNILGSNNMKIETFMALFDNYDLSRQFISSMVWRALIMNNESPHIPDLVVSVTHYNQNEPFSIVMSGKPDIVAHWEKYFLETYQAESIKKVSILSGVARDGSFRIQNTTFQDVSAKIGYDAFYPFIEGGIQKLVEDYEAADETIMLFIGEPGLGKSTLIRSLMKLMSYQHYGICNNQQALESPEIGDWIGSFGADSLISLEDADNYIKSREKGNTQMSALLNLADGVMKVNRKIVISTNLTSVNAVDEALIRPGRTFKVVEFRKLTIEEANAARACIGLSELPDTEDLPAFLTLAEALNYERQNNVHTKVSKTFGFGLKK